VLWHDKGKHFFNNSTDYSPNKTWIEFLAPTLTQSFISFLIDSRRIVVGEDLFWKTLAFISFESVQLVSMVSEAIALRFGEALLEDIVDHHPSTQS
jgi:hypothetical protein